MRTRVWIILCSVLIFVVWILPIASTVAKSAPELDRSPIDFQFCANGKQLISVNQTSATISLVDIETGKILSEVPCGERPTAVAITPDAKTALVTATYSGELYSYAIEGESLRPQGKLALGYEPRGIAVAPDGKSAYVALTAAGAVSVVDLQSLKERQKIDVGRWPRNLAVSPDGSRLAVGVNGDGGVAVVDLVAGKRLFLEDFNGLNLGQMVCSSDGQYVYFPWAVYRGRPIQEFNVRNGWVVASRIARVKLGNAARREAIALDPMGMAVSDPHGIALSPDEQWLYCSAAGTHELLVYRLPGLPFQDYGGPGDHIDAGLLADSKRFYRIPLGGRPMALRMGPDGKSVYVVNYLLNCIQIVDPAEKKVVRTIPLGGPAAASVVRRGEAIFYDGQRSFEQWYSCHSCHYEGHSNAVTMDTRNDGRFGNYKTVLSLRNVSETGPWAWHGWSKDLDSITKKSLVDSMLGKEPTDDDVKALVAFLKTIKSPPKTGPQAEKSEAVRRGEAVFRGEKANCVSCHSGSYFTDGKIHSVGTNEKGDVYKGYNPPSLIGVGDRLMFLHDGRAKSLEELLTKHHNPEEIVGRGSLSAEELADLIAYLKSL